MAEATLAFPAPTRDIPQSTFEQRKSARESGSVIDLGTIRRQRAFEAAPAQFHDFEVDLFTTLLGCMGKKARKRAISNLEAYQRFPPNASYKAAIDRLMARQGRAF